MTDQPIRLTVGGDVQANRGTYLTRPADEQLYETCLASEFAYVLACRQIGKSSLKNAVAERLTAQGIRVARIDLNRIGQNVEEAEDWYFSLLAEMARTLGLETDVETWWERQPQRSTLAQRFLRFLDEVVLAEISEPLVIFIDEIDMTLGLPFTDDFFAAIRVVYNDRAQNPAYQRLTFVLLGVATPDELISEPDRTPFNIGRAIPIRDFTQAECALLRLAIEAEHSGQGDVYFRQIHDWTDGHPYLTQKLCEAVVKAPTTDDPDLVDNLVGAIFLTKEAHTEENLRFVQNRVLDDYHTSQMLQIYKEVLQGKIVPDDEKSLAVNRLKLFGLVTAENGSLKPRNRIYAEVFDLAWIKEHTPLRSIPYRQMTFALATILIVLLGYLAYESYITSKVGKYMEQAEAAYDSGDLEQALADLNKALELDPDLITYVYSFLDVSDDPEQTILNFTKAIELYPDNAVLWCNRGDTYLEQGD